MPGLGMRTKLARFDVQEPDKFHLMKETYLCPARGARPICADEKSHPVNPEPADNGRTLLTNTCLYLHRLID